MLKRFITSCACLGLMLGAGACDRSLTLVEETQSAAKSACFDCHSDTNTTVVAAEQSWLNSRYASGANIVSATM